jgi:uncharacterized protein with PQ loop repeat
MDTYIFYIGMISSLLLAITPFFQVFSTFRLKSAKDISIYFIILQIIASSGFMLYGSLINEIWIIIPNTSLVFTNILIGSMKCYFEKTNNELPI